MGSILPLLGRHNKKEGAASVLPLDLIEGSAATPTLALPSAAISFFIALLTQNFKIGYKMKKSEAT